MKQKFRHRSTYQAYFRWGEKSKRKSYMLSLLSRLIFTETLLELCLAGRWFYFNSRLVHLCTEIPPVGNLEGMCSLEMSISTSFFCLLCFWEEPTALHRFCCVWLWVTIVCVRSHVHLWTVQPVMETLLFHDSGNPAFPWLWASCLHCKIPISRHGVVLCQIMPSKGHFCTRHISSSHDKKVGWSCCRYILQVLYNLYGITINVKLYRFHQAKN